MTRVEELIFEIESLPVDMRIQIADRVLESLKRRDPELEEKWLKEAKRRNEEIESGTEEAVSGEEFLAELEKRSDSE